MNHDVSHCSDYNPDTCPKSCYRAQVTAELETRGDLIGIPLSFMHFYRSGDSECPRSPHYDPPAKHTWGEVLRGMSNQQMALLFSLWGYCPGGKQASNDHRCKKFGLCTDCWQAFLEEVSDNG